VVAVVDGQEIIAPLADRLRRSFIRGILWSVRKAPGGNATALFLCLSSGVSCALQVSCAWRSIRRVNAALSLALEAGGREGTGECFATLSR
jgi:hypothetical protein